MTVRFSQQAGLYEAGFGGCVPGDVDFTDNDLDFPTVAPAGAVGCDDANAVTAVARECRTGRVQMAARVGCENGFFCGI